MNLDLTRAILSPGEARVQILGVAGEVDLLMPENIGLEVHSNAVVTDAKVLGEDVDNVFMPFLWRSMNYLSSEKKLIVETTMLISRIKVNQIPALT